MITDINSRKIKSDNHLSNLFINANFSNLSINCNILKGNFFSDSFYYFPITENNETFSSLFTRDLNNISHFYSQKFFDKGSMLKFNPSIICSISQRKLKKISSNSDLFFP